MSRACEQFERLINIINRLRGEDGCPWDKEQTHKSLIPYLLEETYEVIEAIEDNDINALREELGDLSLHILFQAHIARENGQFEIADSLQHICDKLERRHPHVFSNLDVNGVQDIHRNWETIKHQENKRKKFLDGVPKSLPALNRARRLQEKAANVGFDWPDIVPVWDKLHEELDELKEARSQGDQDAMEEELGDLLFSIVNLGRWLNISSEEALRRTMSKFEMRFAEIETGLKSQGKSLEDATLEEMDILWEAQKKKSPVEKT